MKKIAYLLGEKMKALFTFCERWEQGCCKNEDLRYLYLKKESEGKNFKLLKEEGLRKFNKICALCNHSFLVKEKKCPICECKDIQGPYYQYLL